MRPEERRLVELATEYSINAGLPEPFAVCAEYLPPPYTGFGDIWRFPVDFSYRKDLTGNGPIGLSPGEARALAEAFGASDPGELWHRSRRDYALLLARIRPAWEALAALPVAFNTGYLPVPGVPPSRLTGLSVNVFHQYLEGMCREWAHWVTVALSWFWLGDDAPEIPVFPGTEGMTDEHVARVMAYAQREIDKETNQKFYGRAVGPLRLRDLPWDRQRRLAEARRFVFHRYGVTRSTWEENRWSFWEVPRYG